MRGYYLVFLSAAIASTTLMLLATYEHYKEAVQAVMMLIGLTSSLITIYEFFFRR
ncbi:MAG: hypothetical protein OHK0011_16080 [Turneriella sp.]